MPIKDKSEYDVLWCIHDPLLKGKLTEKLPKVIEDLGYKVRVSSDSFIDTELYEEYGFLEEGHGPIIGYGTHRFYQKALRQPWLPGCFPGTKEEIKNLSIGTYATKYRSADFLNNRYILVPIKQLINHAEWYVNMLQTNKIFVKDTEFFKRFTGEVVNSEDLSIFLQKQKDLYQIPDDSLIFINEAHPIFSEHRFVIVNQEVVAHSTYLFDDVVDIRSDVPVGMVEFVQEKIQEWNPTSVYTMDIALVGFTFEAATPKILELNSFSSAGLYACDLEKVVKAVSKQAFKEWSEYNIT